MAETTTQRLTLAPEVDLGALLGRNDENLRLLEAELALRIVARGNELTLRGDERQVARGARIVEELLARIGAGLPVQSSDVRAALRVLADDADADLKSIFLDAIPVPSRKKQITPKTLNQKRYVEADPEPRHRGRHRPRGDGEVVPRDGHGGVRPDPARGRADHPDAAGRRGGRAAGLSPRRHVREGASLPPAALRRPLRHDGAREGRHHDREAARSRSRPSPTCAAAR